MNKNALRCLSVVLAVVMAFVTAPASVTASSGISVKINGETVVFTDQQPLIRDNRTLIPVRGVFEKLGYHVDWDMDTQTVTLTGRGDVVHIIIGSSTFITNGIPHSLDVPAQIINGRTMLPIRSILESVGVEVEWDAVRQTVLVFDYEPSATTPQPTQIPTPQPTQTHEPEATPIPTPTPQPKPTSTPTPLPTPSHSPTPVISPPTITTVTLPDGITRNSYSYTLATTNSTRVTWSIADGELPPGLSLQGNSGRISGRPTTVGTFHFTVQSRHEHGSDTRQLSIRVNTNDISPVIRPESLGGGGISGQLKEGTVGWHYQDMIMTTAGSSPATWSIVSGSLPDGIRMPSGGTIAGQTPSFRLEGRPTTAGTHTFMIRVENAAGFDEMQFTIVIREPFSTPTPTPEPAPAGDDCMELERAVLDIVNGIRANYGLHAFHWDNRLAAAAREHSEDMSQRGFFAHTCPDGWTPWDRMRRHGVYDKHAGENIASGTRNPESVVTMWMNSPGHRVLILDPDFTHLGVGLANFIWTQKFMTN